MVAAPDLVIPTVDTVRHEALLYTWLAEHKPLGTDTGRRLDGAEGREGRSPILVCWSETEGQCGHLGVGLIVLNF